MKVVAVGLLLLIIASLGMGLWFLVQDRGTRDRVAGALTARIALSFLLFLIVLLAMWQGSA